MDGNRILSGYLRERELAAQLGVNPRTCARWRAARTGPPYTRVGKVVLYKIESVRSWLDSREVDTDERSQTRSSRRSRR